MKTLYLFSVLASLGLILLPLAACGGDDDDQDGGLIGDEIWWDPSSELTWQVAPPIDYLHWDDAMAYCDDLSLAGHDDWRLPTISELRTLIRGCTGTVTGGSCGVTDSCLSQATTCYNDDCAPCEYLGGPINDCYSPPDLDSGCYLFWSSSAVADSPHRWWSVDFSTGAIASFDHITIRGARCVHGQ